MRCKYDLQKNLVVKRKHGISLEMAQRIFDQVYGFDQKNDDLAQYRAIGWGDGGRWCVIYEIRRDRRGEYFHLITAWKATAQEEDLYAKNN